MSHCLSCLCPDAGTPCKECGYVQTRHAPGARLGPMVRAPRTPRAELARQERLLTAALLELGALEADGDDCGGMRLHEAQADLGRTWKLDTMRRHVASIRAKRDLAAQAVSS